MASLVTPLRPVQAGGAQAFLSDLAVALAARDHQVTIYCAEGSELPGIRCVTVSPPRGVERALVRMAGPAAQPPPGLGEAFERLFEAVRRDQPEAVSQHAFDAEAIELAVRLPVLHTLHLPPIVPALTEALRRLRPPSAVPSEAMRRAWMGKDVTACVIRDGVPVFDLPAVAVEPVALIAGRVSPEKGVAAGLRLARQAGLEPRLVGSIYDHEYWRREVRLPVAPVARPALWRIMAGSAVTLMPVEWDEPFGLVAAEAQMAGCPVAGYRRGALPEVVEEGVSGMLAEPGDEEGLAALVSQAVALDRSGVRASAVRRLGIDASANAYEEALRSLR